MNWHASPPEKTLAYYTQGFAFKSAFIFFPVVGHTPSWKEEERRDAETTTEYEEGTASVLNVDSLVMLHHHVNLCESWWMTRFFQWLLWTWQLHETLYHIFIIYTLGRQKLTCRNTRKIWWCIYCSTNFVLFRVLKMLTHKWNCGHR